MALSLKRTILLLLLTANVACISGVTQPVLADQNSVIGLNNEGVKALNQSNYDLAILKFEAALKEDHTYGLCRENLAIAHNNYGLKFAKNAKTVSKALSHFHKAAFLNTGNQTTLENIEGVLVTLGKDPKSFNDRVKLANESKVQNDFIGAYIEYKEALKLRNDNEIQARLIDVTRALADLDLVPYSYIAKDILIGKNPSTQSDRDNSVTAVVPLSKDLRKHESFMYEVQRKIRREWYPPADTRSSRTVVRFTIDQNGWVSNEIVTTSSGTLSIDAAALKAIKDASTFPAVKNKIFEPLTVEFYFDYKVFKGGTLPARGKDTYGVEFNLDPPDEKDIADLKNFEKQYVESAADLAESYELFGRLEEARKMYEKISSALQIGFYRDEKALERNRIALERVKTYEAASKMTDSKLFEPILFSCLKKLATDQTISRFTNVGLQQQLVDDAVRCKMDLSQLGNTLSQSGLPIYSKYTFATLLHRAAITNKNPVQQIRALDANVEKFQDEMNYLAWADDLCNTAFRHEISCKYDSALVFFNQALEVKQKYLGPKNADALTITGYIARVLAEQGKIVESQKMYEKALASFKKSDNLDYRYIRFLEVYGDVLTQHQIEPRATQVYNEAVAAWNRSKSTAPD